LVIDCESGNLLNELQEINRAVEEGGLKLLLEVDVRLLSLSTLYVLRNVDECNNVYGELTKDRADDIEIENVVLGAFFGEGFNRL
jgi:hypothetical protein